MSISRSRRFGAHGVAALALFATLTSTGGRAEVPLTVQQAVAEAEDADVLPEVEAPAAPEAKFVGAGEASYYGSELAGNRTASGERFNPRALTAAHRSLPLGTKLRVTNQSNGRSVVVRINDRGPFVKSRLIDVSYAAAQEIGMIRSGKAKVRLEQLS